jgi:hypothetical protein
MLFKSILRVARATAVAYSLVIEDRELLIASGGRKTRAALLPTPVTQLRVVLFVHCCFKLEEMPPRMGNALA